MMDGPMPSVCWEYSETETFCHVEKFTDKSAGSHKR